MNRWIPLAALLALAMGEARGGAYMRSEGELMHDVRVDYARATREWDAAGNTQRSPCEQHHSSLSTALDYGFSYYLSGFAKFGAAYTECDLQRDAGPSDLSLGIRGRLNTFTNNRSWELEALVPARALGGASDLGCDAYGGALRLEARSEVMPQAFIGYGVGYRWWDKPLVPQATATLGYSAPIARLARHPRWEWSTGLTATWPLEDAEAVLQGPGTMLDCGTRSRVVRGALDVRYKVGLNSRVGCGLSAPIWGREARLTQGMSCVYSVLWE